MFAGLFAAFAPYRLIASIIAVAALFGGTYIYAQHRQYQADSAAYAAQTLAISQAASKALQAANDKAAAVEQSLQSTKDQLEIQNAQSKKAIDAALAVNRKLATGAGLRDPGSRTACSGTVSKDTGSTGIDTATTTEPARLSDTAAEFLLTFAYDADQVAAYAQTCHDWAMSVTGK
ncbi:MAG: hypothetical protein ACYCZJ_13115 [Sulfuriferula sp.]